MKQMYQTFEMRNSTLELIERMNVMVEDYMRQGFTLSVRQLYYQLVARDIIPNTEKSYKRIVDVVNKARLGGFMDWDAIEDRNRDIEMKTRWASGASIVQASADSFHRDMWDSQADRVFIIVEKAALAGVLGAVSRRWDVPLLAARGYPSVSIVREMALEHFADPIAHGQYVTVLHLGDHDPSGIDMTRDLRERFELFLGEEASESFNLRRIALSMEQIEQYEPPPNPAKVTDSRFAGYEREHGSESWELDALEPKQLIALVTDELEQFIDPDAWEQETARTEQIRSQIQKVSTEFAKRGI